MKRREGRKKQFQNSVDFPESPSKKNKARLLYAKTFPRIIRE